MKKQILFFVFLSINFLLQAQVSKKVNVTSGGLSLALTTTEKTTVTNLTVTGTIDARDFKTIRDDMTVLAVLDLSAIAISEYTGTEGTDFYRSFYPEKAIPSCAFWGKKSLTSILLPSSVTSLQGFAFSSCTGLTSLSIPSSVINIEYLTFYDCTYLINVDVNNPTYSSLEGVLFNKTKSTLIQCPTTKAGSYIIPSSVTTIEKGAFSYCNGLTSVVIPPSVTTILDGAFSNCTELTSFTFPPKVSSIARGLLRFCTGLKLVTIPSSVDSIGVMAFSDCTGLTSIIIPPSVKAIESEAFSNCIGLTSLAIPSSVSSIASRAFYGCIGLTSLFIPSSVTTIGSEAFNGCTGLNSITLTRTVPLYISSAYNIFGEIITLCTLNVPFGTKSAYQADSQWQLFKNIVEAANGFILSSSIASIEATAGSTTTIDITSNINWTASSDQKWLNVSPSSGTGNNTITLISVEENTASTNRKATVTISATGIDPQTISVTQAESNTPLMITAGGLKNLFTVDELPIITKLTLSGTMDARDFKTMRDDMPLLAIVDLSRVKITDYTGTEGTSGTSNIAYPANAIPGFSFRNPSTLDYNISLTRVNIPSSVISIGYSAFKDCTHLISINISSSIASIGKYSFKNCSSLINVDENNPNYSSIDGVLYNKAKTTLIQCPTSKTGIFIIQSSVASIGISAFENCKGLTSLSIPSSVKSIDADAFYRSTGLISIYVYSTFPPFLIDGGNVFGEVNSSKCTLYVPIDCWYVYYKTMNWGNWAHIVEFDAGTTHTKLMNTLQISLYPNPVTDGFRVSGIKVTSTLSVFDINSKLLFTKMINSNEYVSVSSLPHGVYIVRINSETDILEEKIIKN